MRFFHLTLVATTASAILVVPQITKEGEKEVFRTLPVEPGVVSIAARDCKNSVHLPCRQCPGKDTHLALDFEVQDNKRLALNGYELYPSADPWTGDLIALATSEGDSDAALASLGYTLAVTPLASDQELKMELVSMDLKIIEVAGYWMGDIPSVQVKVIIAPDGDIIIGDLSVEEQKSKPASDCDTLVCKAKDIFRQTIKKFKGSKLHGCGGNSHHRQGHVMKGSGEGKDRRPPHGKNYGHQDDEGHNDDKMEGDYDSHHHGNHYGGHYRHRLRHELGRLFDSIAVHMFIPVILGVGAGVGFAMFVMFFVKMVASIVRFCRRTAGESGESLKVAAIRTEGHTDEQVYLMEEELPVYEHAPPYSDEKQ